MITVTLLFILFSLLIWKWSFIRQLPFGFFVRYSLFLVKIAAGAAFFYIYTYYYSDNRRLKSDLWKYYEDASYIYGVAQTGNWELFGKIMAGDDKTGYVKKELLENTEFWYKQFNYGLYNENRTIIRFITLAMFITGKNIYALSLLAVFLSYLGGVALFLFFYKIFCSERKYELLIAIFMLPSVIFWTSPLLKEMLVAFSLGFTLYFFSKRKYLLSILFYLLLFFSKIYIALPLIPALLAYVVAQKRKVSVAYLSIYAIFISAVIILHFAGSNYDILQKLSLKQNDFIKMALDQQAGSFIQIHRLNNSITDFILATPQALLNSLFRPFLFDYKSVIVLPNILENLAILLFLVYVAITFKKPESKEKLNVAVFSVTYSLSVLLIIGYTVPVLGALVRYRAPVLPVLIAGLLLFAGKRIKGSKAS